MSAYTICHNRSSKYNNDDNCHHTYLCDDQVDELDLVEEGERGPHPGEGDVDGPVDQPNGYATPHAFCENNDIGAHRS